MFNASRSDLLRLSQTWQRRANEHQAEARHAQHTGGFTKLAAETTAATELAQCARELQELLRA